MTLSKLAMVAGIAIVGLAACETMPTMGGGSRSADANVVRLQADLDGAQQVPVKAVPGKGTGAVTYNKATHVLTWKVDYAGLTGRATMAHFHGPANVGAIAPVVVPLACTPATIAGSATLTEAQAADLLAGKWYLNIHTAANPGGEIRGQVTVR